MIWSAKQGHRIRIQRSNLTYLKLNDSDETFHWFHGPDPLGYMSNAVAPVTLVEWLNE